MFDIGFLEILVVFVLGLVVVGPDRLPGTIKTCAIWVSRFKRSIHEARAEFEQQIGADEIRREIHNEKIMDSMRNLTDARSSLEEKLSNFKKDIEESANETPKIEKPENATNDSQENTHNHGDCQHCDTQNEVSSEFDPNHPPMILDDSGADSSALPGRKANTQAHDTQQEEQNDGKQ